MARAFQPRAYKPTNPALYRAIVRHFAWCTTPEQVEADVASLVEYRYSIREQHYTETDVQHAAARAIARIRAVWKHTDGHCTAKERVEIMKAAALSELSTVTKPDEKPADLWRREA